MNRASRYVNRAGKRGIHWGAVVLGWVVAALTGIMIGFVLGGLYNLVAEVRVERGEDATAAFIIPLLAGFLAYLIGGYVAGRRAGVSGDLNGAMTAVFGLVVGIVVAIVWVVLSLIVAGGERLPTAPVGFGQIAEGAFLAGLILFLVNLPGGYLGGKLGEPGRG